MLLTELRGWPEEFKVMAPQLTEHVVVYSEFLFRLGLFHKRLELLKCIPKDNTSNIKRKETNVPELGQSSSFAFTWK